MGQVIHWVRHGQGYHNLLAECAKKMGYEFRSTGEYEDAKKAKFNPYMEEGIRPGAQE